MRRIRNVLVALVIIAHPLVAQEALHQSGYKDPATAELIGLLGPGFGQLYVGGDAEQRGWYIMSLGYGGLSLGLLLAGPCFDKQAYCTTDNINAFYYGIGWYLGATIAGVSEAGDDARRNNIKRGLSTRNIVPLIQRDRFGRVHVGLALSF